MEPRRLMTTLSVVEPSADEQYMLQLVNRARANPQAEGQRLAALAQSDPILREAMKTGDLAAFLAQIDARPAAAPLAFNTRLIAAARDHDADMVAANAQYHSASGALVRPSNPADLAPDGQPYYPVGNSSWSSAENIFAYSANLPDSHGKALVDYFHSAFLLDWGNPAFGHLKNLLMPGGATASAAGTYGASEIGIGLITDAHPAIAPTSQPAILANKGLNVGPALVTQEFAWRSGHQFLTGAIYTDADGDHFYTPGEGLGGVRIQAVGRHGEGTFATVTWGSGGYSLDLPQGTYDVTASGAGLASPRTATLGIGADNVGWDVASPWTLAPTFAAPVAPATVAATTPVPAASKTASQAANHQPSVVRVVKKHKKTKAKVPPARHRQVATHPKPPHHGRLR